LADHSEGDQEVLAMVLPDLLLIPEVAAALRVKPSTIEEWRSKGKIKSYRPNGGRVVIPASEVARLLKESEQVVIKVGDLLE
jgi:excisionase family DNA binding protein